MVTPPGIKAEDRTRIASKLDEVARKIQQRAASDAMTALEPVRVELAQAARDYPLEKADIDLAYRAAGLNVAALVASGDTDKAKNAASETAALFPGRKPGESDRLPTAAVQVLSAAAPEGTARLTLRSRPDGCEVFVAGSSVGRSPVELPIIAGVTYQAQAVCPGGTGHKSYVKRITVADKDATQTELLDADFERSFEADAGQRLRFASSPERRQLEESSARRVAERYGADVVVLASVGELSGADWLNGRLYLRSGYLNRQALVRLETSRALALGRYLATGHDVPGVLKPEEAGALVAAGQQTDAERAAQMSPWYTDIVGWCFTGAGAVAITLGLLSNASGSRTTDQADAIRGDSERQNALYRDAQRAKFLGGIGLIGGGLMALTGVILLAIPEYSTTQGELFVFSPTPGGATVGLSGRF
jgi:hypothetical protein